MGIQQHTFGRGAVLPPELVACPRATLEALAEALVDHLDALDGDPDLELSGDELDGSLGEDEFCSHNLPPTLQGPGCPIADPDLAVDDGGCDGDEDLEEDHRRVPEYGIDQTTGPLAPLRTADRDATREWRDRIRATRCRPIVSKYYDPSTGTSWGEVRPYEII